MARISIQNPSSEYYAGPKSEADHLIHAAAGGHEVFVEFDNDENFAAALVKAGVNLHKAIESYSKPSLVPSKSKS